MIAELCATSTRAHALSVLTRAFRNSQIDEPEREARIALMGACGLGPLDLIVSPQDVIGDSAERLRDVGHRRSAREPLSRIFGRREFWGLNLAISPATLDPRPETEIVVEVALEFFAARQAEPLRILDLGVGSGAILCALLHAFPRAEGTGVDLSSAAAEAAIVNVETCGLASRARILVNDWTNGVTDRFDLIVSNPPYVRSADIEGLAPEVRLYEPLLALDGGDDGLVAYRKILAAAGRLLMPGGAIVVEIGSGQIVDVCAIAFSAGFRGAASRRDLAGTERVVIATLPPEGERQSQER